MKTWNNAYKETSKSTDIDFATKAKKATTADKFRSKTVAIKIMRIILLKMFVESVGRTQCQDSVRWHIINGTIFTEYEFVARFRKSKTQLKSSNWERHRISFSFKFLMYYSVVRH